VQEALVDQELPDGMQLGAVYGLTLVA